MEKIRKMLHWLETWNVRKSETEVLQQEIASLQQYIEEKTKERDANQEKLNEMQHREYTLYEAYKEVIHDQQKQSFDTF